MDPEAIDADQIIDTLVTKTGYLDVFAVLTIAEFAHLSHIARLIGKSKSTILKTIDSMLAENVPLIEVDETKTLNTRGVKKFYILSEIGKKVDLMIDQSITDERFDMNQNIRIDDEEAYRVAIKQEAITNFAQFGETKLITYFTLGSELNYYFQRASAHGYIRLIRALLKETSNKNIDIIPYGTFFSSLKRIKVSDFNQVLKIKALTMHFMSDLNALEEKIKKENIAKIEQGTITEKDLDSQIVFVNLNPVIGEFQ